MLRKQINIALDSSIFCWFFLPAAIYNIVVSYISMNKQFNVLKDVINENDKFAAALGTLGFKPGKVCNLYAIFETDLDQTDEEIYSVANKQIILIVKNYVVDELLLGIVKIEFYKLRNRKIQIDLQSADKNLFYVDVKNLIYSTIIFSVYCLLYFKLF